MAPLHPPLHSGEGYFGDEWVINHTSSFIEFLDFVLKDQVCGTQMGDVTQE